MEKNISLTLITFAIILGLLALYVFIIMIIWNKVIINKFPSQNIQELNFWDALAISVFVSLLSGPRVISITNKALSNSYI